MVKIFEENKIVTNRNESEQIENISNSNKKNISECNSTPKKSIRIHNIIRKKTQHLHIGK